MGLSFITTNVHPQSILLNMSDTLLVLHLPSVNYGVYFCVLRTSCHRCACLRDQEDLSVHGHLHWEVQMVDYMSIIIAIAHQYCLVFFSFFISSRVFLHTVSAGLADRHHICLITHKFMILRPQNCL